MVIAEYFKGGLRLSIEEAEGFLARHMGRVLKDSVCLNPVESLYALEMGWIEGISVSGEMKDLSWYLKNLTRRGERPLHIYIIYRDLRRRGHVAIWSGDWEIEVLSRKNAPKTVKWNVIPFAYREYVPLPKVYKELRRCTSLKRELLFAFYDTEGDVTYYRVSPFHWQKIPAGRRASSWTGEIVSFKELAVHLFKGEVNGRMRWILLFMDKSEERYLKGDVGKVGSLSHLYSYISERGYVVRSGLKYGADFRIYRTSPDIAHSSYLLRYIGSARPRIKAMDLLAAARIAHGVKKELILAFENKENVGEGDNTAPYLFLSLRWIRV
ncbi:MAG: tRNA-intron lyase [Thermoplasmata archaeon]|nr:tRNA-intron lyase [Thermoplasmata archaeon]